MYIRLLVPVRIFQQPRLLQLQIIILAARKGEHMGLKPQYSVVKQSEHVGLEPQSRVVPRSFTTQVSGG